MIRGEIRLVDFSAALPGEAAGLRPAVIVSNDGANLTAARLGRGVITVVPITSNVARVHPFQVLLSAADSGLSRDSKAQAEQVRAIAFDRITKKLGALPHDQMAEVDEALRLHLAL